MKEIETLNFSLIPWLPEMAGLNIALLFSPFPQETFHPIPDTERAGVSLAKSLFSSAVSACVSQFMLNKTMLIWALRRNWVTWFLCSVNLKTARWPTALVLILWLFSRLIPSETSPVTSRHQTGGSGSFAHTRAHAHTLMSSRSLSKGGELWLNQFIFLHAVSANRKQMSSDAVLSGQTFQAAGKKGCEIWR